MTSHHSGVMTTTTTRVLSSLLLVMAALQYRGCSGARTVLPGNRLPDIVPGKAGIDYPVASSIPETKFRCSDQIYSGYFADPDTHCQVFRICLDGKMTSHLCPNGTLFSQRFFVCDWWFNVDCSKSEGYYFLNEKLQRPPKPGENKGGGTTKEQQQERPAVLQALNEATPTPSFARFDRQAVYSPEPTFAEWTSRHIPSSISSSFVSSSSSFTSSSTTEPSSGGRLRSLDPETAIRAASLRNAGHFQSGSTFPFRHEFLPSDDFPDSPFLKSSKPERQRPTSVVSTARPNAIQTSSKSRPPQDYYKNGNDDKKYTAPVAPTPTKPTLRPTKKQPSIGYNDDRSPSAAPVDNWLLLAKDPDMLNNIVGSAQQYANLKTNGKFQFEDIKPLMYRGPEPSSRPTGRERPNFNPSELLSMNKKPHDPNDFQPSGQQYVSSTTTTTTTTTARPPPAEYYSTTTTLRPVYPTVGIRKAVPASRPSSSLRPPAPPPQARSPQPPPPQASRTIPQQTARPPQEQHPPVAYQVYLTSPPSDYKVIPQSVLKTTYRPPISSAPTVGRPIYTPQASQPRPSFAQRPTVKLITPSQLPLEPHPQIQPPAYPSASSSSQVVVLPSFRPSSNVERINAQSIPIRPSTLISVVLPRSSDNSQPIPTTSSTAAGSKATSSNMKMFPRR